MATSKSIIIPPFPDHINRDVFGQWISGFSDGESCFALGRTAHRDRGKIWTPRAMFVISLRADDIDVLRLIQSYFNFGLINMFPPFGKSKPKARYCINRIGKLDELIIPRFEKYPLFAKKRTDFEIWRDGVRFVTGLRKNGQRGVGRRHGGGKGTWWTTSEKATFDNYIKLLRDNRVYRDPESPVNGHSVPIIEPYRPTSSQGLLFD